MMHISFITGGKNKNYNSQVTQNFIFNTNLLPCFFMN